MPLRLPLTLVILCLNIFHTSAQEHIVTGSLVRAKGDTLHGSFQLQSGRDLTRGVHFKTDADNDFSTYLTDAVRSFSFDDGDTYKVVSFLNTSLDTASWQTGFARVLVQGEYDLYSFIEGTRLFFLVRKDTSLHLLYNDEPNLVYGRKGNYMNELNFFTISCESMRSDIEGVYYSEEKMTTFFRRLDACSSPGKAVASFYHKAKVRLELLGYVGGMSYGDRRNQFTGELQLRMSYPGNFPGISFNLGLRYTQFTKKITDPNYLLAKIYHKEVYTTRSIPLTLQYNILHGRIQPFAYAGISAFTMDISDDLSPHIDHTGDTYYHSVNIAFIYGAGIECYVTHWFMVKADWRAEYITQYPTIGVSLKF